MFFTTRPGGNTLLFVNIPSSPPTDAELDTAAILTSASRIEAEDQNEHVDPNGTWFFVKARVDGSTVRGWVPAKDLDSASPPTPEPLDPWSFVKNCTLAARVTNAGQLNTGLGINRDFMIAYALQETGTATASVPQNISANGRFGPFALTAEQWKTFTDSAANDSGFQADDIETPVFQCYGFAFLVLEATRGISTKFSVNDQAAGSGPYIPSSMELFIHIAMGEAVAFQFIGKMAAAAGGETAHSLLTGVANRDAILARYGAFFGAEADGVTITALEQKLADALDKALKRSFTLVRELTPEDVIYFVSGTLPWLVTAREEKTKGVAEKGIPPNPEVMKYFTATALAPAKEIPWCGAFVAWCLRNCGSEAAKDSVSIATAGTAASWKTWGDVEVPIGAHEADAVAPGTIVILRPQTSDASGHVGFFVNQTAIDITLLGGNQHNEVRETSYGRKEVVAMRMLKGFDSVPTSNAGPGTPDPNFGSGTLGPFTNDDWVLYIQTLGTRESNNNYGAFNRYGYIGRWQFGAGALIDGGYVKTGAVTRLLKQNRWWTGKNGVNGRDDWLANKGNCQDLEMIAYTRRNYKSILNVKASRPFVENASKAQLAGLLATTHLLGPGGTRKFVLGQNTADANGTTAEKYYRILSDAFGGAPNPPKSA